MKFLTPNIILSLILCFGLLITATFSYIFISITEQEIENFLSNLLPSGIQGIVYLIIIISVCSSIGLPRQVAAFTAGFIFDAFWGALISLIGVSIGCIMTYGLAHKLSVIIKTEAPTSLIQKIHVFFSQDTFYKAIMIRLLPVGSNFITNILAGLSRAPKIPYVLGSTLGFIPQIYIFSLAGSGLRLKETESLFVSVTLLFFACVIGYYLYKRSSLSLNWER